MENIYQDIPRLYTALAEWLACMTYCLVLNRKIKNNIFTIYSVIALIIQSAFLVFTKNLPVVFWIPCMLSCIQYHFFYI